MFRQFNLGLNKEEGYGLSTKDAARLNYGSYYAALFSLNIRGCFCSCLSGQVSLVLRRSPPNLSRALTSVSLSIHKLSPGKSIPSVYIQALMVIFSVCMCHTLHLSCHKHSHHSLAGRDRQLTPSVKGLVIVGKTQLSINT